MHVAKVFEVRYAILGIPDSARFLMFCAHAVSDLAVSLRGCKAVSHISECG